VSPSCLATHTLVRMLGALAASGYEAVLPLRPLRGERAGVRWALSAFHSALIAHGSFHMACEPVSRFMGESSLTPSPSPIGWGTYLACRTLPGSFVGNFVENFVEPCRRRQSFRQSSRQRVTLSWTLNTYQRGEGRGENTPRAQPSRG